MGKKTKKSVLKCEICHKPLPMRLLEDGSWETVCVKSSHTGHRYHMPGSPCFR